MKLYVEYYAIENLIVNYIIISCTSILTKNYTSSKKKWTGAVIGMIYAIAYLVPNLDVMFTFPMKVLIILIVSSISFSHNNIKEYIRILFAFYFVNIFIAGSSFFIIYFTGITHITISFIIIVSYLSGIILKLIYRDIKELKYINSMKTNIKVCINKNEIELKALIDTGNLLKDPISQEEVVIISANKLYGILPEEFQLLDFTNININTINDIISHVDESISYRIRMIPVRQINDENLVLGIKSDYIDVDGKKLPNVILGLSNFKEEGYSAILNPQLLVNT
ncbi:sigma-E processing peptidase SpoIIGA [Paraclostridium sordellii]|uniref:sigma-E processing peptidase SpoIIGA n=1 Tax=Paraclostridium sordellii TaxID=1505 RepID=UPI00097CB974|nr:sigma-E processing peptidase SpoIIGA [Paeniclostridium sordellii]